MKKKLFRERYAEKVINNLETYEEPIVEPEPAYAEEEKPVEKKIRKTTTKRKVRK